ncbi:MULTISPECIES: S8 family serine peptidase [unclassified Mesorhizobium]|uniref:S8 family serine peptidase n=1 Tax=unclassified Mesorhizobium TaxID=325217 RepID=UPI001677B42F|nr:MULTISPECIES: S8 family serine peptidase [unclassified Mesorhizobium]
MTQALEGAGGATKPTTAKSYRAFWHLQAIGVLYSDSGVLRLVWEDDPLKGSPPARVALIDTGVDVAHGYLKGRIDDPLDLTGMPISVVKRAAGAASGPFSKLPEKLKDLDLSLDDHLIKKLEKFLEHNKDCTPFDTGAPQTANLNFSSHGTSCAGLVIGRTPAPKPTGTQELAAMGHDDPAPSPILYFGVDPFSRLIPVTTSFAPRPEPLILAFLYAWAQGADAILFPRGLPDDLLDTSRNCKPYWRILREVILAVSRKIPIVCAAGNEAESRLIAPAALAGSAWGPNGVIAVGAMNYRGIRSSYSSYDDDLTACAPSDDGEMFNADQYRLDTTDRTYPDYPYVATLRQNGFHADPEVSAPRQLDPKSNLFAAPAILAIDIPGPYGFEASGNNSNDQSDTQFSGSFTQFGGTSAASAITAGMVALIQRTKKKAARDENARFDGPAVKDLLRQTARIKKLPHLSPEDLGDSDTGDLTPDHINGKDLTRAQAFGAGLIDARKAIEKSVT